MAGLNSSLNGCFKKNTETNLQALAKMVKKILLQDNSNLALQVLKDLNNLLMAPDLVLKMICKTLLLRALEVMSIGETSLLLLLLLADNLLNQFMRSGKKNQS